MGSWFANLHIRKNETATAKTVADCLKTMMEQWGYESVDSETDADATVALLESGDCGWISVCSELFAHDDTLSCKKIAEPISTKLHTDVLGIACFDSDYMYLNLLNAEQELDAWVGIGSGKDVGIDRRTGVTAWKKKVTDYPAFSAAAKQKYVCAEEFLMQAAPCLGISPEQSMVTPKDAERMESAQYFYFRMQEDTEPVLLPQLSLYSMDAKLPCLIDRCSELHIFSWGTAAYGLSLYLIGPGVEDGTLTFSDVCFGRHGRAFPIMLEKKQLPDGRWAYAYHDPEFPIPEGPPKRLKWEKQRSILWEKHMDLQFVPRGDSRKTLDIIVAVVPDQNPQGQFQWNVWASYGSKAEFIKHHNSLWKRVRAFEEDPNQLLPLLKEEDFD